MLHTRRGTIGQEDGKVRQFSMIRRQFIMIALLFILASACLPAHSATNAKRSGIEARVNRLFSKLTQREKLSLLTGTGFTTQPIPRLGIPAMNMVDGPRGVR